MNMWEAKKLIYRGRENFRAAYRGNELIWQRLLPSEYQELEYLESTGTQYIDTGYVFSGNEEIEFDFQYLGNFNSGDVFFTGTQNLDAAKGGFWVEKYVRASTWQWFVRYNSVVSVSSPQVSTGLNDRYSISVGPGYFKVNGTKVLQPKNDGSYQDTPIIFFGRFNKAGGFSGGKLKCWKYTIKKNGTLVRSFIPAIRNSDGELGMFDTVTGTFFTNQGTGKFIGGPVVR